MSRSSAGVFTSRKHRFSIELHRVVRLAFVGTAIVTILLYVSIYLADIGKAVPKKAYILSQNHVSDWTPIGGKWTVRDGYVSNSHSDVRGAKLMAGSNHWGNYTLSSDVRFDSDRGDMGIIIRSNEEQVGTDAYNGYYVGLRMGEGSLIIGRSDYGWVEASPVPLPGGIHPLQWYRLRVTAYGCDIGASVQNLATLQVAWVAFEERKCVKTGRIGLRSVDVEGAWRNIEISPAQKSDYLEFEKHTDFVERPVVLTGPPWWTPWHLTLTFAGLMAVIFLIQLSYYRLQQWKIETITHERERLAHDIHDTMAQSFAGLGYHIQGIRSAVVRGGISDPVSVAEQLSVAYQLIRRCHVEASETIAMLGATLPADYQDMLAHLTETARSIAGEGIHIRSEVQGEAVALNLSIVDALQHIGKEAIANAVSHSGLTELGIHMHYSDSFVELFITDNGRGFDCERLPGFGILGMQKRARGVGGSMKIVSTPATGTKVQVLVELRHNEFRNMLASRIRRAARALLIQIGIVADPR